MNFLSSGRHRARSTGCKLQIKLAGGLCYLPSRQHFQFTAPNPFKIKGRGGGNQSFLDFYASLLNKKERQETYSFSPQFKNQTVYMSSCNRSHDHKVGGGTQTHGNAGGGITLSRLSWIRHWLTATPSARPNFCSKFTCMDFIRRFAPNSKI